MTYTTTTRNSARKPAKAIIAKALADYVVWSARVESRTMACGVDGAYTIVSSWANDVKNRIMAGDLSFSTHALIRSTMRVVENLESGYYTGVTDNGGFIRKSA